MLNFFFMFWCVLVWYTLAFNMWSKQCESGVNLSFLETNKIIMPVQLAVYSWQFTVWQFAVSGVLFFLVIHFYFSLFENLQLIYVDFFLFFE